MTRGRGQEPVYSFPIADVLRNMTQVICFYVIACVCVCVCVRTRMPAVLLVGLADVRRTRNSGSKRCATRRRTRQKIPVSTHRQSVGTPVRVASSISKTKIVGDVVTHLPGSQIVLCRRDYSTGNSAATVRRATLTRRPGCVLS